MEGMGRPSMPLDEAARVVAAMRWLIAERYGGQRELAEAMGVSRPAVGQHLSGRNRPSHENAIQVARLCGTSAEALRSGAWRPGGIGQSDRVAEWVRSGLVSSRAVQLVAPYLASSQRADVEVLTALRLVDDALRLLI